MDSLINALFRCIWIISTQYHNFLLLNKLLRVGGGRLRGASFKVLLKFAVCNDLNVVFEIFPRNL